MVDEVLDRNPSLNHEHPKTAQVAAEPNATPIGSGSALFILSGWSDVPSLGPDEPEPPVAWRCWCAAHRPIVSRGTRPISNSGGDTPISESVFSVSASTSRTTASPPARLVILEFELDYADDDTTYARGRFGETSSESLTSQAGSDTSRKHGPETLDPSVGPSSVMPVTSTISRQNRSAHGIEEHISPSKPLTNEAVQTLPTLDARPDQRPLNLLTSAPVLASPQTGESGDVLVDAEQSRFDQLHHDDDDDEDNHDYDRTIASEDDNAPQVYHSLDDIRQSTTIRSKPIRSLDKLRLMAGTQAFRPDQSPSRPWLRGSGSESGSSSGRSSPDENKSQASCGIERGSEGSRTSRGSAALGNFGAVGTMDIMQVLDDVVHQLGKTQDLDELLKVVVGVIEDLTKFHRVMVYQFDDEWNGEVRDSCWFTIWHTKPGGHFRSLPSWWIGRRLTTCTEACTSLHQTFRLR